MIDSRAIKLMSAAIHYAEFLGPNGHFADKAAADSIMSDPTVQTYIEELGPLLPVMRATSKPPQP